jgi:hypothetical protein
MKKDIIIDTGKWNLVFGLVPAFYDRCYEFHFGLFKITSHPPIGETITKSNYKGFWIRKKFRGFGISMHF